MHGYQIKRLKHGKIEDPPPSLAAAPPPLPEPPFHGRLISTAHSDGYVFMWDMRTGRALSSVLHHTDQTRSLDFSRDGSSLLTASYDGLIGVCDCRPRAAPAASPGEASSGSGGVGVGAAEAPQVRVGFGGEGGGACFTVVGDYLVVA